MGQDNDRVDRPGRNAVKGILRGYGEMTAALRAAPGFLIIGAKRGGTTSLYNYLLEHPSVQPLFPGRPWITPAISGEASPYYLFHPLAASRVARNLPDVRLIILLRDPTERAYSHYKERLRHGGEWLSFEEALDAEPDRLSGEAERIASEPGYRSVAHEDHSYVAQGRYLDMLPRWFDLFGRDRFYVTASEDFYADPGRVVNEIWSFLGLPPVTLLSVRRYNYHQAPDLSPATRRWLVSEFADHNDELEQFLGR